MYVISILFLYSGNGSNPAKSARVQSWSLSDRKFKIWTNLAALSRSPRSGTKSNVFCPTRNVRKICPNLPKKKSPNRRRKTKTISNAPSSNFTQIRHVELDGNSLFRDTCVLFKWGLVYTEFLPARIISGIQFTELQLTVYLNYMLLGQCCFC